jgi:drug/metabolite transporter (DMT)-like permease
LYVALYEALIQKTGLGKKRTCGLILGLTGAMLFLDVTGETPNLIGVALAGLSGVCYATYIIVLGRESKNPMPLYRLMLTVSTTGSVLCCAVGLAMGRLTIHLTGSAWVCAAAVSMLVAVVACVLFQAGVRLIGKANAAIFSLLEPITSILFSILLLNDHLSPAKLAGCVLILAGLFITVMHESGAGKQKLS